MKVHISGEEMWVDVLGHHKPKQHICFHEALFKVLSSHGWLYFKDKPVEVEFLYLMACKCVTFTRTQPLSYPQNILKFMVP